MISLKPNKWKTDLWQRQNSDKILPKSRILNNELKCKYSSPINVMKMLPLRDNINRNIVFLSTDYGNKMSIYYTDTNEHK